MKKRGFLVCFTGLDGSGKSTHAKALMKYLERQGYHCNYVWGASRPLISYSFFAVTKLLGYWKRSKEDSYTDPLEFATRRLGERLAVLLRILLFMDFQIKTTKIIRTRLFFGKTVICDRYFYDLLMDLNVTGKNSNYFSSIIPKTLPYPDIAFLLDAPVNLTKQRRNFTEEELTLKKNAFLKIGERYRLCLIDSSLDYDVNQKKIREMTLHAFDQFKTKN